MHIDRGLKGRISLAGKLESVSKEIESRSHVLFSPHQPSALFDGYVSRRLVE